MVSKFYKELVQKRRYLLRNDEIVDIPGAYTVILLNYTLSLKYFQYNIVFKSILNNK